MRLHVTMPSKAIRALSSTENVSSDLNKSIFFVFCVNLISIQTWFGQVKHFMGTPKTGDDVNSTSYNFSNRIKMTF